MLTNEARTCIFTALKELGMDDPETKEDFGCLDVLVATGILNIIGGRTFEDVGSILEFEGGVHIDCLYGQMAMRNSSGQSFLVPHDNRVSFIRSHL